ncbi:hypothetical protein ACTXJU_18240 [Glutamicibacter ardleyensis]|uniref:hypothetical protein n=1 Tax=Glutamicibacter ardleyensis TaxID=225894 RepID=UPI003FD28103
MPRHGKRLQPVERLGLVPGQRLVPDHEPMGVHAGRVGLDHGGEPAVPRPSLLLVLCHESRDPVCPLGILDHRTNPAVGAHPSRVRGCHPGKGVSDPDAEILGDGGGDHDLGTAAGQRAFGQSGHQQRQSRLACFLQRRRGNQGKVHVPNRAGPCSRLFTRREVQTGAGNQCG